MAFYLKYRPQKLADLDLKEVREGMAKALSSPEIPHAFLFAGPRGTGKTSAARIVAKAVNCQKVQRCRGAEVQSKKNEKTLHLGRKAAGEPLNLCEPCNQCDSCLSITAGTNLDVLEIDAASNRGIDDIRNLREKIKLAPAKAKYKVYIIDETHMLTSEAFNALLKTLEEPPKHAIFVLCTTAPEKLPATIISRCLRFNFRKAKIGELVSGLEKIVKDEKLTVGKGVLEKIAQAADGSFRDSQKILEQVSFGREKITGQVVDDILGQVQGAGPEKLLVFLVQRDAKEAILEIGRVVEKGVDLRWYSEQLLGLLRLGLLVKLGVEPDGLLGNAETLKLTEALKIEEVKYLIEIFSRATMELRTAIIPQLPLEIGVVEWCEKEFEVRGSRVEGISSKPSNPSSPSFSSGPSQPFGLSSPSNPNLSFDSLCQKWPQVLQAVGPKNHSVQAFLRATRPKDFDGENLILEVFYEFHKTQLESEKCRRLVEEVVAAVLKRPVKIKCVLSEKPKPIKNPGSPSKPSLSSQPGNQKERYHLPLPSQPEAEDDIMSIAEEIFGKTAD